MTKPLTGRKVLMIFVFGFGIVIAVNFYMASLALSGFSGVVVKNSYVASQNFNGWLDRAEEQKALGWTAKVARDEQGLLIVSTSDIPAGSILSAEIRRPLGQPDTSKVEFKQEGDGKFSSIGPVAQGRWIVRLTIESGGNSWIEEQQI